jgi:hypothetical protein
LKEVKTIIPMSEKAATFPWQVYAVAVFGRFYTIIILSLLPYSTADVSIRILKDFSVA